jgi:uncharacterized protein
VDRVFLDANVLFSAAYRKDAGLQRLWRLAEPDEQQPLPADLDLPDKDLPIFLAALAGNATHLLTGDFKHFGRYFGKTVEGILILPPADYLENRQLGKID